MGRVGRGNGAWTGSRLGCPHARDREWGYKGREGREARAGSWARSAWESKNPKLELGLPGPRGGHLSRKEAAAISFAFLPYFVMFSF